MFILAICASRERYFRNNGWTRSKVEKREQGLQLGNPRITHPESKEFEECIFPLKFEFACGKRCPWPPYAKHLVRDKISSVVTRAKNFFSTFEVQPLFRKYCSREAQIAKINTDTQSNLECSYGLKIKTLQVNCTLMVYLYRALS